MFPALVDEVNKAKSILQGWKRTQYTLANIGLMNVHFHTTENTFIYTSNLFIQSLRQKKEKLSW